MKRHKPKFKIGDTILYVGSFAEATCKVVDIKYHSPDAKCGQYHLKLIEQIKGDYYADGSSVTSHNEEHCMKRINHVNSPLWKKLEGIK